MALPSLAVPSELHLSIWAAMHISVVDAGAETCGLVMSTGSVQGKMGGWEWRSRINDM